MPAAVYINDTGLTGSIIFIFVQQASEIIYHENKSELIQWYKKEKKRNS